MVVLAHHQGDYPPSCDCAGACISSIHVCVCVCGPHSTSSVVVLLEVVWWINKKSCKKQLKLKAEASPSNVHQYILLLVLARAIAISIDVAILVLPAVVVEHQDYLCLW